MDFFAALSFETVAVRPYHGKGALSTVIGYGLVSLTSMAPDEERRTRTLRVRTSQLTS